MTAEVGRGRSDDRWGHAHDSARRLDSCDIDRSLFVTPVMAKPLSAAEAKLRRCEVPTRDASQREKTDCIPNGILQR